VGAEAPGFASLTYEEVLRIQSLFSPDMIQFDADGPKGDLSKSVAEYFAESLETLTDAFVSCPELTACALVKNHAEFVFMENPADRLFKLNGSPFDVIQDSAFAIAFEKSLLKAREQNPQFASKLSLIDGLVST